jgi:hypothetical protein
MKSLALSFFFVLFLSACSSEPTISTISGNAAQGGIPVRLISIDDRGNEIVQLDQVLTQADGSFTFPEGPDPASSVLLSAELPQGTLRAFAADGFARELTLNAVSDGLVRAVILITQTEGGRTLSDFEPSEIRMISDEVDENIEGAVDVTDQNAVLNAVIAAAGRSIPEAAGGILSAIDSSGLEPANDVSSAPALAASADCGRLSAPLEGLQFNFDFTESGTVCNVNGVTTPLTDAFDIAFELSLVGDTFLDTGDGFFPGDNHAGDPDRLVEDDREFVTGPSVTDLGLEITRKAYVPEGEDYVRFLEVIENPTDDDITTTLQLSGEFGIGTIADPPLILSDTTGDRVSDVDDDWAIFIPPFNSTGSPTVSLLWNGENSRHRADSTLLPTDNGNSFLLRWEDLTIPAGGMKTIVTYTRVMTTLNDSKAKGLTETIYTGPDMTGMSSVELAALENFQPSVGNVAGEAGSVVSSAVVTATNTETDESQTVTAGTDGSFKIMISASSGDGIEVTASDGLGTTLTAD